MFYYFFGKRLQSNLIMTNGIDAGGSQISRFIPFLKKYVMVKVLDLLFPITFLGVCRLQNSPGGGAVVYSRK